jgi:hypothetical protein
VRGKAPPRSEAEKAAIAKFKEDYAALQSQNILPPLFPSRLHRHEPDCEGEPEHTIVQATNITVIRCKRTGNIIREVRP